MLSSGCYAFVCSCLICDKTKYCKEETPDECKDCNVECSQNKDKGETK